MHKPSLLIVLWVEMNQNLRDDSDILLTLHYVILSMEKVTFTASFMLLHVMQIVKIITSDSTLSSSK